MATLSLRLKELRRDADLTQEELAARLGIDRATLASWETGRRQPDLDMAAKIADYFRVNVDYLLGRTDDPTPPSKGSSEDWESQAHYMTDQEFEALLRGRGLSQHDIEWIKQLERQRALEREKGQIK